MLSVTGKRYTRLSYLLSILVLMLVFAHPAFSGFILEKWPHEKSNLKPDPNLVFGKLDNGFMYVLMKNKKPENRVSMHLNIQAGSLHEKPDQRGLAHFLEHMMFDGTRHFEPGELVKYFQRIGMNYGPDANAHTSFNETVYDIVLPDNDPKDIEEGLTVFRDYADGALLLEEEIEKERKVILAEKRTRDSASYRILKKTLTFEFPGTLIPKRLPIGIEAVLRNAGRKELKDFYDTWYRPDAMILVMVGDFNIEKAIPLIEKKFSDFTARAPKQPEPDLGAIDRAGQRNAFHHYEKEVGNTDVVLEVIETTEPVNDSRKLEKQRLIEHIGFQILQNRMDALQSRPDTPFTQAFAHSGLYLKEIKYASLSAECSPEKWKETLMFLDRNLRKALVYGFTAPELTRVKKELMSELENAVKEAPTRNSTHLARQLINQLNSNRVFTSPQQDLELYSPIIEELQLETVNRAFQKNWPEEKILITVTGNAKIEDTKGYKSPDDYILSVYEKSRNMEIEKPSREKEAAFPYLKKPETKGRIASRKTLEGTDIQRVVFENGVVLNLKKTDFTANEIRFNLSFGQGGSGEPVRLPGLSALAGPVINESGFGSMDKETLKRALAGNQSRIHFSVQENSFLLMGSSTPDETDLMFQLLYTFLLDPGFGEDAWKLVMERFAQKYKSLTRSVEGAMTLYGMGFFSGNDPRFGLPPYERFRKLTLTDVKNWILPAINNSRLELSVVGDMDPEKVIRTAAEYLGGLSRTPSPENKTLAGNMQPVFPSQKTLGIEVKTSIEKGLAVVAFPTDDIWDISQTRRFSVLASVLSDRLRIHIRETLGAAYSSFAYNKPSRAYEGYGFLQAMAQIDPGMTEKIIREIKNIAAELTQNGIGEDELRRAVDPILTNIREIREKNDYWLNQVLTGSWQHPEQIEWSKTILEDHRSITRKDVEKLAKKYLVEEKAATFFVLPVKKDKKKDKNESKQSEAPVQ